MFKYLKYSNIKLSVDLNPFVWNIIYKYEGPTRRDPHLRMMYLRIFMLSFVVVIDDGTFNLNDVLEEENGTHQRSNKRPNRKS